MKYYILCYRHQYTGEFCLNWWGKNSSGYTFNLDNAGEYSEEEIKRFEDHHHDDFPIPVEDVRKLQKRMVIDTYKLGWVVLNSYSNRRKLRVLKKYMIKQDSCNWDWRAFKTPEHFLEDNKNTERLLKEIVQESTNGKN